MTETDILAPLNPVQREAVTATRGPVLVLAGAGSGKTRVLTRKVAHLVRDLEVSPARILAFTFTNKAAQEMRERIAHMLGGELGRLWVGTFHATSLRILRQYAAEAGLDRAFTIYDREDSLRLVKDAIRSVHVAEHEFKPRSVLERISAAKSGGVPPAALAETAGSRFEELTAELYAHYQEALDARAALDFDDLLWRALRLLREDEEVRRDLSGRFLHVLVDEYQDTNQVQFQLIRELASGHRNLTVVGDDDQSIYGWRGADIRNILDFEEHYPDARTFRLEQNYRSTQRILSAANAVVAHNEGRKPKTLWTENEEGDPLTLAVAPDEEREAEYAIQKVRECVMAGRSLSDVAILYRTNAQSRPLEDVCLRHRVPYRIVGGVQFFQRREVKDALAYLKVAVNAADEISFDRAIQTPKRGIGATSLERLKEAAASRGLDLVSASAAAGELPGLTRRAATTFVEFAALIGRVRAMEAQDPADEVIELVLRESGLLTALDDSDPENATRRENLEELVAGARAHALRAEDPGFRAYVEEVALRTDIDAWDPGEGRLTLMTVHNAKGLEFDVVLVLGLEEGRFPHASAREDPGGIEEERRLFYVALTRARKRCVLAASMDRRRFHMVETIQPSRFLEEIPEGLLRREDPWGLGLSSGRFSSTSRVRRDGAVRRRPAAPAVVPESDDGPVIDLDADRDGRTLVGRVVLHPKYGRGVVLRQDGTGDAAKCEVRFMGQVTKKIVARFLDLESDDEFV